MKNQQHPKLRHSDFMRYENNDACSHNKGNIDVEETLRLLTAELEKRGQLDRWGLPADAYKKYKTVKGAQRLETFVAFAGANEKQLGHVLDCINSTCSKSAAAIYFNNLAAQIKAEGGDCKRDPRVGHSAANVLKAIELNWPDRGYTNVRHAGNNGKRGAPKHDLYEVQRASDKKWSTADTASAYRQGKQPRYTHDTAQHHKCLAAIDLHPDREFVRWDDGKRNQQVVTHCTKHDVENTSQIADDNLVNLNCRECLIEQESAHWDWTVKLERLIRLYRLLGADPSEKSGVYVLKNDHTYKVGMTRDFKGRGYAEHFVASRRKACSQMVALLIEQTLLNEFDIRNLEKLPYDEYHTLMPTLNGRSESFTSEDVFLSVCKRFDQLKHLDVDDLITVYEQS